MSDKQHRSLSVLIIAAPPGVLVTVKDADELANLTGGDTGVKDRVFKVVELLDSGGGDGDGDLRQQAKLPRGGEEGGDGAGLPEPDGSGETPAAMQGRTLCHHPNKLVVDGAEGEFLSVIGAVAVFAEKLKVNLTCEFFKLLGFACCVRPSCVVVNW